MTYRWQFTVYGRIYLHELIDKVLHAHGIYWTDVKKVDLDILESWHALDPYCSKMVPSPKDTWATFYIESDDVPAIEIAGTQNGTGWVVSRAKSDWKSP